MKKLIVLVIVVLAMSGLVLAQDTPSVELFGGYSYMRVNPGFGLDGVNTSGWEASLNYNFGPHWSLKGDIDGQYCCNGQHLHSFMAGPQWSYRREKATFFLHGLLGGAHAEGLASASDTNLAWAVGGGFDWKFTDRMSWRVVQADYVGTNFVDEIQSNARISTGLVFRFGQK
jgi:opacity protein-like surface antigen